MNTLILILFVASAVVLHISLEVVGQESTGGQSSDYGTGTTGSSESYGDSTMTGGTGGYPQQSVTTGGGVPSTGAEGYGGLETLGILGGLAGLGALGLTWRRRKAQRLNMTHPYAMHPNEQYEHPYQTNIHPGHEQAYGAHAPHTTYPHTNRPHQIVIHQHLHPEEHGQPAHHNASHSTVHEVHREPQHHEVHEVHHVPERQEVRHEYLHRPTSVHTS